MRDRLGHPPVDVAMVRPLVSSGGKKIINTFYPDCTPEEEQIYLEEFYANYSNNLLSGNAGLFANIEYVLTELIKQNIKLAIATNKLSKFTRPILSKLNLEKKMDSVYCRDDVSAAKPSPEMIVKIMRETNSVATRTFILGDDYNDIAAGNDANIVSIIAGYGYGEPKRFASWNADYCIHNPKDLLKIVI